MVESFQKETIYQDPNDRHFLQLLCLLSREQLGSLVSLFTSPLLYHIS